MDRQCSDGDLKEADILLPVTKPQLIYEPPITRCRAFLEALRSCCIAAVLSGVIFTCVCSTCALVEALVTRHQDAPQNASSILVALVTPLSRPPAYDTTAACLRGDVRALPAPARCSQRWHRRECLYARM
jgi:hypothetical protein